MVFGALGYYQKDFLLFSNDTSHFIKIGCRFITIETNPKCPNKPLQWSRALHLGKKPLTTTESDRKPT